MTDPRPGFDTIHETYRPKIVRYLARLVGEHEAEDLAQEVFVRVARGLPAFRGDSRLSTWIYRIARNVAVDRLRGGALPRLAQAAAPGEGAGDDNARQEAVPADSVERAFIRDEMSSCIRRLVDGLPRNDRAVIVLGEMNELKDREVADVLGVTVGTAKMRLHRARARLKREMEQRCDLYRASDDTLACDEKPCP